LQVPDESEQVPGLKAAEPLSEKVMVPVGTVPLSPNTAAEHVATVFTATVAGHPTDVRVEPDGSSIEGQEST